MAESKLTEKLDFSFSIKDFDEMTKLFEPYIQERIEFYKNLFCQEVSPDKESILEYIHYFITPILSSEEAKEKNIKTHPFIGRVIHFLNRNYEFYILPGVQENIQMLLYCFSLTREDIEEQTNFEEYENKMIDIIIKEWEELYKKVLDFPYLTIKNFKNEIINGISVYYKEESIDPELYAIYRQFIVDMNTVFPISLKRIDSILFVPQSYIDFSAGEGTTAYFLEDEIFMPEQIKEEDKTFFVETLYHEFGHFIFALLPEASQILWYRFYQEWSTSEFIKLTRDEGKNEVEELFADGFSILYSPLHDYLQRPSEIILDTVKNLIKDNFQD